MTEKALGTLIDLIDAAILDDGTPEEHKLLSDTREVINKRWLSVCDACKGHKKIFIGPDEYGKCPKCLGK